MNVMTCKKCSTILPADARFCLECGARVGVGYERVPIPKKLRFEVLKRDDFTCQYCGRKSPQITLHIDHVLPVAEGGTNEIINLITACQDCNSGKGANLLADDSYVEMERLRAERQLRLEFYLRANHASIGCLARAVRALWGYPVIKEEHNPYTLFRLRLARRDRLTAADEHAAKVTTARKISNSWRFGQLDKRREIIKDESREAYRIRDVIQSYFLAAEEADERNILDDYLKTCDRVITRLAYVKSLVSGFVETSPFYPGRGDVPWKAIFDIHMEDRL